jgi:hypothetical protein
MKRWFELFLFALILVLPQVDLPDFTFHGGTAPIAARSRVSSAPVLSMVAVPLQSRSPQPFREKRSQPISSAIRPNPPFLALTFLRSPLLATRGLTLGPFPINFRPRIGGRARNP